MIVEADSAVRTFVGEALRRRGYHVLETASGANALDVFASYPSSIHLVVCDSRAVTAQGAPLVARLQGIDPIVQSLVMIEALDGDAGGHRVLPTTPQHPEALYASSAGRQGPRSARLRGRPRLVTCLS